MIISFSFSSNNTNHLENIDMICPHVRTPYKKVRNEYSTSKIGFYDEQPISLYSSHAYRLQLRRWPQSL